MNDGPNRLPHFLRVARSLARVSSVAIPVAAVLASSVPGCGARSGLEWMGGTTSGAGGSGGAGGGEGGGGGYGVGGSVGTGIVVMSSSATGVYDGGGVGDMSMQPAPPDGG